MRFAWRVLFGSLRHQRARLSIAALAMALGSALVSGLLNLSGDIGGQVGHELRAYGANVIIRPREPSLPAGGGELDFGAVSSAATFRESDLESIKRVRDVVGFVPYLYTIVEVEERRAVLAGVDPLAARALNAWWQVQGRWPEAEDEILVGVRAAAALSLEPGDIVKVGYGSEARKLRVVGLLETGGTEDDQLFGDLPTVQSLTGQPGQLGLVMVSALTSGRPLEAVARELQDLMPDAEVRTLAQFAQAEATVLNKVRLLIGLVAALVLIAGSLTVAGTLNTIVMERRAEIGLMRALGAADLRVAGLFLAEALSVGATGGLVGYLAGLALAGAIGRQVFETTITPAAWGLPGTLLVGLSVTLGAGLLPVRRAMDIDPARTLRGE
ncbi:MAG TPA: ABC transporter permease [Anaerolineales bacterium]|nr:ABC transporter permease [Anaerolineales bacterium]